METASPTHTAPTTRLELTLLGVGTFGLVAALASHPSDAMSAARQVWPAFVLVAGLLLIGLVAQEDRLFSYAGRLLAYRLRGGIGLLAGSSLLITLVTATLNLDTAVVFLTPVFVSLAHSRGEIDSPYIYLCLMLANAGSLFLPGSNLTNLIVVGDGMVRGGEFLALMWPTAVTAVVATVLVVAWLWRGRLKTPALTLAPPGLPEFGLGLGAVIVAMIVVLAIPHPAVPVMICGLAAVTIRILQRRERLERAVQTLGLPTLFGLFGVSVAFGTLGRAWSGPAELLSDLGVFGTIGAGAFSALAINNLPAASLLAAQSPANPYALLVGLNVGPNLLVTGSLAWFLWLRVARAAGAAPSIPRASLIGAFAVPIALLASGWVLILTGGQ